MSIRNRPATFARRLAITGAALVGTALTPLPAFAQDATWNGATADYNTGGNWNPAGVPTNIATLANTGQTTVAVTANSTINEILIAANAQQYSFLNDSTLTINGIGTAGIVSNSSLGQIVSNYRTMTFNNNAMVMATGSGAISLRNESNGGSTPVMTFNNNSGIGANVFVLSFGAITSAVGTTSTGANASIIFNNTSHADGVTMNFSGGVAGAQTGVASATATGGSHNATFNDSSHADGADITNEGGLGTSLGQSANLALVATATGGNANLTFNNNSHADNAQIENRGASASALIIEGNSTATGGNATLTLNDSSHIDGASLTNVGSFTSGAGGQGGASNGVVGGLATSVGGIAFTYFNGSSHADNATIMNLGGALSLAGGAGGAGGVSAGGNGGQAIGTSGGATIVFNGSSHANGATITNDNGSTTVTGGQGGAGGTTGAGGIGGAVSGSGGGTFLLFNNGTGITGATITNNAGDALAYGGNGGAGGAGAAGGNGNGAAATGSTAAVTFIGTTSAGTGTTIVNQGGDGSARGGNGGAGGSAAGGNGGAAGAATATGGSAFITFNDTTSAGNANITNTGGTATATIGDGGNGDVGNGGGGGGANAFGGNAVITFNNSATAANATIVNQRGALPTTVTGTFGTNGGGGGQGGFPGLSGTAGSGNAIITFNNNATAGNATIISNGDINFNNSATGGSSKITNQAGGVIRFSNSSVFGTAAGALITMQGGNVSFNDTASLGSGSINNLGGTLNFFGSSTAGSGAITNAAGGFFRFQDNATSGAATINNAGNLGYLDNSTAGTSVITNSGSLGFSGSSDALNARVINTGTGIVAVGVSSFRLGSLSGGGVLDNNGNIVQVGYLNLNDTFTGVIQGSGQLVKRGTGTMVLTGVNTLTGTTTVVAGTLQIDGSIASASTVVVGGANGGTLRGVGTIGGGLTVNGTLNPGNAATPTGTLRVTGNVSFGAGSVYLVNIAGAASNLLLANGSLTLGGGTVRPSATPGTFFLMQNDYRIAAGSSIGSNFAGLDTSLLPTNITASLFYTATDAFLRLRRNSTAFAQTPNLTPNQLAVSTSLDQAVAANNPLVFTTYLGTYNNLLGQSAATLPGALDTLSGDALTVFPVAAQGHANRFADRLNAYTWSNSSNLWGLIAYGDQNADGDGNGPGFSANGVEFQMGFNTSLGQNTRLGLSVGMNNGDVTVDDARLTTGNVDTWSLGAQLRHDFGQVYVSGQLTYSWHSIDSSRSLLLGGTATADYDATTWTAGGELGWVAQSGQLSIEPHLSIRHASTSTDAYSETGPVGVLNVAAADYETTRFGIGIRLANRTPAAPVKFYMLARYEHETGDNQSALDNILVGLPTYRVVGTRLGDDILSGEIGGEFRISNGLSLFVAGGGHTRSNETSLQGNAGLRIVF